MIRATILAACLASAAAFAPSSGFAPKTLARSSRSGMLIVGYNMDVSTFAKEFSKKFARLDLF